MPDIKFSLRSRCFRNLCNVHIHLSNRSCVITGCILICVDAIEKNNTTLERSFIHGRAAITTPHHSYLYIHRRHLIERHSHRSSQNAANVITLCHCIHWLKLSFFVTGCILICVDAIGKNKTMLERSFIYGRSAVTTPHQTYLYSHCRHLIE
jgi:hypothetical protein